MHWNFITCKISWLSSFIIDNIYLLEVHIISGFMCGIQSSWTCLELPSYSPQGEVINNIEYHVQCAANHVEKGVINIENTSELKKSVNRVSCCMHDCNKTDWPCLVEKMCSHHHMSCGSVDYCNYHHHYNSCCCK